MKTTIIFPDAMLAVIDVLRDKLDHVDQDVVSGYSIGTKIPQDKTIDAPSLPYIMVRLDGSSLDKRLDEEATIRVAVWHKTEAQGLALAQVARAVLLSYEGGPAIRVINPLSGAIPSSDPESGAPLSSFTVAVKLRPTNL